MNKDKEDLPTIKDVVLKSRESRLQQIEARMKRTEEYRKKVDELLYVAYKKEELR